MEYEELRPLVFEVLKQGEETQIVNILNSVENLAVSKGFYGNAATYTYGGSSTEHKMPPEDREKVREIISDLINEGILCWGINEHNPAPPHLKVTRHGKESLKHQTPQPYDPDGYLRYLRKEIQNVDNTIFVYIAESLNAYLRGLMLSSTVMLGCASEKAFLLLNEAFIDSISDNTKKQQVNNSINSQRGVKKQFDVFRTNLNLVKKQLPKGLSDDLDIQLDGVFNFIRNCRNDVGHPTGRQIDRTLAFNNLRLFIPYCKRVYDLIGFFNKNKIYI